MFTIGQQVAAKNSRQNLGRNGGTTTPTRKVMEIAQVIEETPIIGGRGYKLRKPGSTSKGGQTIWLEKDLEAI